jgi:hypothetical protein
MGEGGADRWCLEVVSTTEAVAIIGRDCDGGGTRRDRFFRFRARRPGELGLGSALLDGFGDSRGTSADRDVCDAGSI